MGRVRLASLTVDTLNRLCTPLVVQPVIGRPSRASLDRSRGP